MVDETIVYNKYEKNTIVLEQNQVFSRGIAEVARHSRFVAKLWLFRNMRIEKD